MISYSIPIPDSGYHIQGTLSGNVDGLVPPRVEVSVDDPSLSKSLLIFVSENHIWVTVAPNIASFQIFSFHDFDCKDVVCDFPLPLSNGGCMLLNYLSASVDVHLMLELVKLLCRKVDIVQLNERLLDVNIAPPAAGRHTSG